MPKSTLEQEVLIVGDDFSPGAQGNAEIDFLLGFDTHMLDDMAVRSEKSGCIMAPNYCENIELTLQELDKINLDPLILPVIETSKRKRSEEHSPMLTVSFVFNDEHHITKPFETEALALSCALWYALAYHS